VVEAGEAGVLWVVMTAFDLVEVAGEEVEGGGVGDGGVWVGGGGDSIGDEGRAAR
jgi:hypothetical protein